MATNVPEEWSSSLGDKMDRTRLIGPLAHYLLMWQSVHMKKVIRTVEMSAELDAAVERMAKDTARTPSEIVSAAVEQLLADNDDLVIEIARWAEYERTGEAMEEEEVSDRLRSLKQRHRQTPAT